MNQTRVHFETRDPPVIVSSEETILEAATRSQIGISAICGGSGLCGKCRIVVLEGQQCLSPITTSEKLCISQDDLSKGYRLACCATVRGNADVVVKVPTESNVEERRLLVAGVHTEIPLHPAVRKIVVRLKRPTIHQIRSDTEIVQDATSERTSLTHLTFSHSAMSQLPDAIREGNWIVTVTLLFDKEVIRIQPGDCGDVAYGLAVDIGSTKLAAYLLNLKNGSVVSTASCANPQIPFGDDIISRISNAKNETNLKKLQGLVVAAINKLLVETCATAGISNRDVCDVVAVGNTAMHHLFLGISPQYVAQSPYAPVIRTSVTLPCSEIGLHANNSAYAYLLPNIAGFVGADAVADVISTAIHESEEPSLLIDIGTNTEIVMGDRERLVSCSCASGPALEGGCVTHGMRAETGAIERVYIDPQNFEPGYQTIGATSPRGICGSGILDTIASLFWSGIIDRSGKFNADLRTPRLRKQGYLKEYVLAFGKETATDTDIVVNQKDIEEIQLAKAAIFAGTSILMKELRLNDDDISSVFLAGAFGTYTDPQSALIVGMYPDIALSRIKFVGNAAGSGARLALRSMEVREKAEQVAKRIEYIELAANLHFSRELADALYLPHKDATRFPSVCSLAESRRRSVTRLESGTTSQNQ